MARISRVTCSDLQTSAPGIANIGAPCARSEHFGRRLDQPQLARGCNSKSRVISLIASWTSFFIALPHARCDGVVSHLNQSRHDRPAAPAAGARLDLAAVNVEAPEAAWASAADQAGAAGSWWEGPTLLRMSIPELHSDCAWIANKYGEYSSENLTGFSASSFVHWARGNWATNVSNRPLVERRNLLHIGAAGLVPEMLQEQGIDTEVGFGRAGISRQRLADPELVVPLAWLARVFASAVAATAQSEFALLVGLRAGSRFIGDEQGQTPNQPPASVALMRIISQPTSFPNSLLSLSMSGNTCTIECAQLHSKLTGRDQLVDCAMGFATGALRVLCGPRWRPLGFRFAHHPPDPPRHTALLQAPITFNSDVTAMEFESSWLDRNDVNPPGNISRHIHQRQTHRDLVGEVQAILASRNAIGIPSAPAVASKLGLKPRTLHRLLGKQGTSFTRLVEDKRYDSAQQLLRESAAPIRSIAWSLGYVDASAFSRAFRRWSGRTPNEWRKATEPISQ
jgi:AraC-like DNA-binding protein